MKNTNNSNLAPLFNLEGLTTGVLKGLSLDSGFCKRQGKIDPAEFFEDMCNLSLEGTVSNNDLAARMQARIGVCVSRQAFSQRMNSGCLKYFQHALEHVMRSKLNFFEGEDKVEPGVFKRILIQDSTVIKLPLRLFDHFSGVSNATTSVCNARIQGVYDLLAQKFVYFSIDSYSTNDLAVACDLHVKAGDLILRDRGYFKIEAIKKQVLKGADIIFRYKHKTNLYHPKTKKELNLFDLLYQKDSLDMEVLVGKKEQYKMRIMAVRVNEETANLRRMKAKKNNKGHNPSKELLELLSYSIFLITITSELLTFEHVFRLYALRWRIENIFKTWKSNFSFAKIHNVSENQLRILLTARLIMITLFYHKLYVPLSAKLLSAHDVHLSLMKFMRYIEKNLSYFLKKFSTRVNEVSLLKALKQYCRYEKRKREHFLTNKEKILADIKPCFS